MSTRRLVEIAIKGKDESKGAFDSLNQSLTGGKVGAAALAAGIAAVGFALVKAGDSLKKFVTEMAGLGDEMDKMSLRTGIAVEELSAFGFAIERGGGSIADVEAGMRRLTRSISDLREGLETSRRAWDQLGLSVRDLTGPDGQLKSLDSMLPLIADGLRGIQSQAERMDVAQELFGRGGTALLPMLQQGEAGIRAMRVEMQKYGGTMTTEFADKSAAFADSQTNLANATQRLKEALAEPFLEPFTRAVNALAEAIASGQRMAGKGAELRTFLGPETTPEMVRNAELVALSQATGMDMVELVRSGPRSPARDHSPVGLPGVFPFGAGAMNEAHVERTLAPMYESFDGLQGMLLEVDTSSQSLTEGFKMMSDEQARLTIEMEKWMNTTPFVRDSILNIASSLDQAFFAALTSTESFGRAFVAALRRTFADTLASIGGSLVTAGLMGVVGAISGAGSAGASGGGFIGPPSPKSAWAGNKSMPGQAALYGMGHANYDAAVAYGKAYL